MVTKWFALFCTRSLTSPSYEEKLNKIRARSKFNTRRLSLYFMDFVRFPWYCDRMCSPQFFFFNLRELVSFNMATLPSTSCLCRPQAFLFGWRVLRVKLWTPCYEAPRYPSSSSSFENISKQLRKHCHKQMLSIYCQNGDGKQIKNLKKK